jgi:Xaa-Pro aminopeptidase
VNPLLNLKRAQDVFGAAGLDAVMATTHANVRYLSGFVGFGQRLMPSTQVYAVARLDMLGEPTVVLPAGELDMWAQFPPEHATLAPYGRFFVEVAGNGEVLSDEIARYHTLVEGQVQATSLAAISSQLEALGSQARIGVDERGISAAARDALRTRFGDRLVDAAAMFDQVRIVKTPEEIRRLTRATEVIEAAYQKAVAEAREGMTEVEMAMVFDSETISLGCDPVFTVIAFGDRSALPNAMPGNGKLREGDIIRFDIGCRSEGYNSDIARTAIFGEASPKQRDYYHAILEGEKRAIEQVQVGVTASEIFTTAVEATRKAGIAHYRRHHVGHGIGLDVYDMPILNETTSTPLEAGMVLEVETPYYELGFGGLQVEDTILVTDDGHRRLTGSTSELVLVG